MHTTIKNMSWKVIIFLALILFVGLSSSRALGADANAAPQHGFLTGPAAGEPLVVAQNYVWENRAQLGLATSDLDDVVIDHYVSSHNGVTHVEMRQRYQGIEVFNRSILINVAADGSIINLHQTFITDLARNVNTAVPTISAITAVENASAEAGLTLTQPLTVQTAAKSADQATVLSNGGVAQQAIKAHLVYEELGRGNVRLAWAVEVDEAARPQWWLSRIDAVSGELLARHDFTISEDFHAQAQAANGFVFDEAAQAAPFAGAANKAAAANDLLVYEWPVESPIHNPTGTPGTPTEGRTIQNAPWLDAPAASPSGWNNDGSSSYTITRGNNVFAFDNGNNPNVSPDCGASLDCNFNIDLSLGANTYEAAAITNLFYWNNILHDVAYLYGFDEVARNFQNDNFGNGGVGNDYVDARGQMTGTCNAFFSTPSDGSNGRMDMYICPGTGSAERDGDLDSGVMAHEFGHGISNRLTGGSSVSCLNNAEQMGEGWSDFNALMLSIEAGDLGPDTRPIGTWLLNQTATGAGIRTHPYSTDMGVNPHTYDDIKGTGGQPHDVGEKWAMILWEMNWALVNNGVSQNGLDLDIYNGTGGNNLAYQLVLDGMKLQPCNPGFVSGRDGILAADLANNAGVNQCAMWEAFAKRGLGASAVEGSTSDVDDGTEAFDVPAICLQTLKIDKTAPATAGAGDIISYDFLVENDTAGTLTGIEITDTVPANTVYVLASATCGGSEAAGIVTFPIGTMAAGASQTCSFSVTIDGSYGTTTIFTEDFEGGYAGWTMDGLWNAEAQGDTCGTTASPFPSPSNAAYYGDDAACNYDSGTNSGSLTMAAPVMITGTSPKLNYSSYSVTEGGSTYDKRMVDISTDGGTSWTQVGSFSDSSGTWLSAQVDLSAYSGQNALLRFRFDSIDSISNAFFGWMVDDIAITDQKSVPNTACVTATEGDSDCDSATTLVTGGTSTAVGLSSVSAETSSTSALLLTFVAAFGMLGILLLRRRSAK